MKTINKEFARLKRFREAYPELNEVPGKQIRNCFLKDKEVRRSVNQELKELVKYAIV